MAKQIQAMKIYIGAENSISPLGKTAESNFEAIKKGISGIKWHTKVGFDQKDLYLSKIKDISFEQNSHRFDDLLQECSLSTLQQLNTEIIQSQKTIIIVSSTKGNINLLQNQAKERHSLLKSAEKIQQKFKATHFPLIVSNACISGVAAINVAHQLIENKLYDNALVVGADIISPFVLWGFQSLFAISNAPCLPFDKNRKGITMGEGAASVFISKNKALFKTKPMQLLGGVSTNDANHISGPSRTGEGLYRAIQKTMQKHTIENKQIDFISAHGTATNYNDEMESIAFYRLGMQDVALNSLKGFYGHTLGAAGLIETAMTLQSMRHQTLIKSKGYTTQGTSHQLNILQQNKKQEIHIALKTASGFGGCNAALLLKNEL